MLSFCDLEMLFARHAVRLHQWDDLAKEAGRVTPPLAHFLARSQRCVLKTGEPRAVSASLSLRAQLA